jgi:hypothetical protein
LLFAVDKTLQAPRVDVIAAVSLRIQPVVVIGIIGMLATVLLAAISRATGHMHCSA